ncbi:flagellar motor switch protein FliN [Verrucomicrobia bacterium]|nr:flagellar motor switch protein FliN [Verrucomicrobiota bacterium]MDC0219860.1 flagellar motor switch protein FliN [Verrucomicrobiota bacterium]
MSDTETTEETTTEATVKATAPDSAAATAAPSNLDFLLDVPVKLSAELGSCKMTMQELLDLDLGTVVQLDKPANANVDVYVNQKLVARGEVVVAEDNFGIRIKEIVAQAAGP